MSKKVFQNILQKVGKILHIFVLIFFVLVHWQYNTSAFLYFFAPIIKTYFITDFIRVMPIIFYIFIKLLAL